MKKNKMMRLASAMMVMTLMTTSVISGTFAKYTTQDAAKDEARVAKWGVELQAIGQLYGETYKNTIVANDNAGLTVQANDYLNVDNKDVVAPGTENNTGLAFSLKGTPEVSSKTKVVIKTQNIFLNAGDYGVMVATDEVTAENFEELKTELYTSSDDTNFAIATTWSDSANYYTLEDYVKVTDNYYPVVYALTGTTSYTGSDADDTISEIGSAIANKIGLPAVSTDGNKVTTYEVTSDEIKPNIPLATQFKLDEEKITWNWAFSDDNSKAGDLAVEDDKADTILGNLMAGTTAVKVVKLTTDLKSATVPTKYTDYCLETQFNIDITVTQVD